MAPLENSLSINFSACFYPSLLGKAKKQKQKSDANSICRLTVHGSKLAHTPIFFGLGILFVKNLNRDVLRQVKDYPAHHSCQYSLLHHSKPTSLIFVPCQPFEEASRFSTPHLWYNSDFMCLRLRLSKLNNYAHGSSKIENGT